MKYYDGKKYLITSSPSISLSLSLAPNAIVTKNI